jgi:hypothetical protein
MKGLRAIFIIAAACFFQAQAEEAEMEEEREIQEIQEETEKQEIEDERFEAQEEIIEDPEQETETIETIDDALTAAPDADNIDSNPEVDAGIPTYVSLETDSPVPSEVIVPAVNFSAAAPFGSPVRGS